MSQKRFPYARNLTAYARSIGYTGNTDVYVYDGRVVSHGLICWFEFCDRCRIMRAKEAGTVLADHPLTTPACHSSP